MKKNLLLSIFSGLLLWIAWPPTPYTTFFLFVGFVPMLLAMENIIQSTVTGKGKKIFNTTFIGFFIWNTLCVYWVYNSLKNRRPGCGRIPYAYPLCAWAIADGHRLLAVLPGKTYCRAHPIVNRIGLFLDRLRIPAPKLGPQLPMDDFGQWFCNIT
jgi:apolipoprotein N-acyltransferase